MPVHVQYVSLPTLTLSGPPGRGYGDVWWVDHHAFHPPRLILPVVCVPLSDHTSPSTPSSPPRPVSPLSGSDCPLAALSFLTVCGHSLGAGVPSALWCAGCMLALSSSSPLCWRFGAGGWCRSSFQPFYSVNPHCLVILFELTILLLFGFSACFFYTLLFSEFRKHVSLFFNLLVPSVIWQKWTIGVGTVVYRMVFCIK